MSDAVVQRLDRLESRIAIEELAYNYCHGFDKRDQALFMSIWSDDCVWNIGPPFGSFEGLEGVERALVEILWPAWSLSQHVTSNVVVAFTDADEARAQCDVDCTGKLADSTEATFVGASYRDLLVRRDGVWKIRQRDVTIHYFNQFPGTTLTAPE